MPYLWKQAGCWGNALPYLRPDRRTQTLTRTLRRLRRSIACRRQRLSHLWGGPPSAAAVSLAARGAQSRCFACRRHLWSDDLCLGAMATAHRCSDDANLADCGHGAQRYAHEYRSGHVDRNADDHTDSAAEPYGNIHVHIDSQIRALYGVPRRLAGGHCRSF